MNNPSYSLRPYEPRDLSELLDVWRRSSDLAHPFLSAAFQDSQAKAIEELYLPNTETWVLTTEGSLRGFVSLMGDEVGGLFVDPACHGSGYGRALMDQALTLRTRLELDVFEQNTLGRAFYDRYGFTVSGGSVHEETGQPVVRMTKSASV